MNFKKFFKTHIYSLSLSNESKLEKVFQISFPLWKIVLFSFILIIILFLISLFLIVVTPIIRLSPHYMDEESRYETIDNIMRVDSIAQQLEQNQIFVNNILTVFNTDRKPSDSIEITPNTNPMTVDSLISRSKTEEKFIKMMEEREKYNISILTPLAADGMMFYPVSEQSIISDNSKSDKTARFIVPSGEPISAIADGYIIDINYSGQEGGYSVIIQHKKGFLSRYSHLGNLMCEKGDAVSAGQIIAFPHQGSGKNGNTIYLEMWRNGNPLIPYNVLNFDTY